MRTSDYRLHINIFGIDRWPALSVLIARATNVTIDCGLKMGYKIISGYNFRCCIDQRNCSIIITGSARKGRLLETSVGNILVNVAS